MGESRIEDVDDAYKLLLTIIALVFGAMTSNIDILYPGESPERVAQIFLRLTVIPVLILTFIWIGAKLIQNDNYSVSLKLVDWMMALNLTIGGLFMYFRDIRYIQGDLENIFGYIATPVIPLFVYIAVYPRYRHMYPEVIFFENIWGFILVAVVAELLWRATLLFATGSLA